MPRYWVVALVNPAAGTAYETARRHTKAEATEEMERQRRQVGLGTHRLVVLQSLDTFSRGRRRTRGHAATPHRHTHR